MTIFLAFDIYGTVIDTAGVTDAMRPHVGDRAPAFARAWREKQLEYAFRRGLMRDYRDFAVCTRQALEHTCLVYRIALALPQRDALLDLYRRLPAFPDAKSGLAALKVLPVRLYAFSMGRPDDLESLLVASGTVSYFEEIVSLMDVRMVKPDPGAYAYFHRRAGTDGAETWLVSGNPFDVIGGIAAGMRGAWVRRAADAVFDPWEYAPTLTVDSLDALAAQFRTRFAR